MSSNRLAACIKPVIEGLEARQLMSVTITQFNDSEGHNTLRIRGDGKNDTVTIFDDNVNGQVDVVANGNPSTWFYPNFGDAAFGEIEVFDVDLKGGKDSISFSNATAYFAEPRAIHLDGDTGDDTINMDLTQGVSVDSHVTVQIDGDSGNDTITATVDSILSAVLDIDITAGDGNDYALVDIDGTTISGTVGPHYDSRVSVAVDLGSGKNLGRFNGYGTEVEGDSVLDIDFKGGNSTGSSFDDINVDLGHVYLNGKLFVDVTANAGDDKVTALIDGLALVGKVYGDYESYYYYSPVAVFNLNGGDGKDNITVHNKFGSTTYEGTYVSAESFLSITVRGGNGDDKITLDLSENFDIQAGQDQGGQFVLNVDGQNNADTINTTIVFGDQVNAGGGGQADISIKGGQQADKVTVNATDNSTTKVLFGPSLYAFLIDGQTDSKDVANVFTVGLSQNPTVRNFETSSVVNL